MIYADNAATTRMDLAAYHAMQSWLQVEYGNASQPYSYARKPKQALANAREIIAACINAQPDEIYFTSGGTESDNWVIKSSAFSDPDHRETITTAFEHHAVLNSCAVIERLGYPVSYLMPDESGKVLPEALRAKITDRTRLVSVMFANNEIGSIQPIRELCSVAHEHGVLFHTDAVQAVGHVKIDVKELGVDFLSSSAHKFNGPKGIGFLYIRNGADLLPYMDGGAQEKKHRAGTENIAAISGMAEALKGNCEYMEQNEEHIRGLETMILNALSAAGVRFQRNGGDYTLPGLMSLSFPGFSGEAILHRMDLMGICISTGSACDSVNTEISHVLRAINLEDSLATGTVRISLGKFNTVEDAARISESLIRIVK